MFRPALVERCAGKREIEDLEVKLLRVFLDANVVRLEIAVSDAFFFEVPNHLEQIFTEAGEELQREPAHGLQFTGEGVATGLVVRRLGDFFRFAASALAGSFLRSHSPAYSMTKPVLPPGKESSSLALTMSS